MMGYYTRFKLSMFIYQDEKTSKKYNDVVEKIKEVSGYSNPFGEEVKWYDWEEDMKKVSLQFSDIVLILEGEGEESGDIWRAYFKNGKYQYCPAEITFDEFDETKLK